MDMDPSICANGWRPVRCRVLCCAVSGITGSHKQAHMRPTDPQTRGKEKFKRDGAKILMGKNPPERIKLPNEKAAVVYECGLVITVALAIPVAVSTSLFQRPPRVRSEARLVDRVARAVHSPLLAMGRCRFSRSELTTDSKDGLVRDCRVLFVYNLLRRMPLSTR